MKVNKINSSDALEQLLEIVEDLAKIENLQKFMDNMRHLDKGHDWDLFEWWEAYLAWSEVSTEEDMERYYDFE